MGLHSGELAGLGTAAAVNFGVPGSPKLSDRIAGAKSTAVVPSVLKRTNARTRDQVISPCTVFGRNFQRRIASIADSTNKGGPSSTRELPLTSPSGETARPISTVPVI